MDLVVIWWSSWWRGRVTWVTQIVRQPGEVPPLGCQDNVRVLMNAFFVSWGWWIQLTAAPACCLKGVWYRAGFDKWLQSGGLWYIIIFLPTWCRQPQGASGGNAAKVWCGRTWKSAWDAASLWSECCPSCFLRVVQVFCHFLSPAPYDYSLPFLWLPFTMSIKE